MKFNRIVFLALGALSLSCGTTEITEIMWKETVCSDFMFEKETKENIEHVLKSMSQNINGYMKHIVKSESYIKNFLINTIYECLPSSLISQKTFELIKKSHQYQIKKSGEIFVYTDHTGQLFVCEDRSLEGENEKILKQLKALIIDGRTQLLYNASRKPHYLPDMATLHSADGAKYMLVYHVCFCLSQDVQQKTGMVNTNDVLQKNRATDSSHQYFNIQLVFSDNYLLESGVSDADTWLCRGGLPMTEYNDLRVTVINYQPTDSSAST